MRAWNMVAAGQKERRCSLTTSAPEGIIQVIINTLHVAASRFETLTKNRLFDCKDTYFHDECKLFAVFLCADPSYLTYVNTFAGLSCLLMIGRGRYYTMTVNFPLALRRSP